MRISSTLKQQAMLVMRSIDENAGPIYAVRTAVWKHNVRLLDDLQLWCAGSACLLGTGLAGKHMTYCLSAGVAGTGAVCGAVLGNQSLALCCCVGWTQILVAGL